MVFSSFIHHNGTKNKEDLYNTFLIHPSTPLFLLCVFVVVGSAQKKTATDLSKPVAVSAAVLK